MVKAMKTPRRHRRPAVSWPPLLLVAGVGACTPFGVVSGMGASVATYAAEERGVDGAATDTMIDARIRSAWFEADADLVATLGLTVRERRVLLTGAVRDEDQLVTAVRLAWQPEDVVEVINEIRVVPEGDLGDAARDRLIASDLRTRLLLDAQVKSINYAVEVSDRVVYLFGVAQTAAERKRVMRWARQTDYVRRVVDHTLLRDDPRRMAPSETDADVAGGTIGEGQ
jgi:osmotically-inducible protein OsmY